MKIDVPVSLSAALLAASLYAVPIPATSQETGPAEQSAGADAKPIKKLIERLRQVERELNEYRAKEMRQPDDATQRQIVPHLESMQLRTSTYGPKGSRYFVARLALANTTNEPAVLKQQNVTLEVDGKPYRLRGGAAVYLHYPVQMGSERVLVRDLAPSKVLDVPPRGTASEWLYFDELPNGDHVPALVLKLNFGKWSEELDVNAFAAQMLGLKVERIGPHECLGLLSISGTLNTVNLGTVVEALEGLAADGIGHCVIRGTENSPAPVSPADVWLFNAATNSTLPFTPLDEEPPEFPRNIKMYFASMPGDRSSSLPSGPKRLHKQDAEAVEAALKSVYETLPRDEVLQEIRFGHPLARAAALADGGARLASDKLPLILGYADDDDPLMQRAALKALSHFGEASAVDKLLYYAHKGSEPLAETAIESLAASRYADAHAALLKLLENKDPKSKVAILRILAQHPRPVWSEAIYRYCQDPQSGLNVEALRALVQVGHPKLMDVLTRALAGSDASLRDEAFAQLVNRTDRESEAVAMDYTLKYLEKAPPTAAMYELLYRTGDRRAIPLLLSHLTTPSNRERLIQFLRHFDDQRVAQVLADNYAEFSPSEQGVALATLLKLGSPRFNELAAEALLSSSDELAFTTVALIQDEGVPDRVDMLADALESTNNSHAWHFLCGALAFNTTPEARAALRKARDSGIQMKRVYALHWLREQRRRSPGIQYIYEARSFERRQQWNEALKRYDAAVKIDPALPEALSGRGNVYLRLNRYMQAGKDLEKALELDPYNSMAITGLAMVMVLDDKRDQGIAKMEQALSKAGDDALFAYNAACVYARALEMLEADKQAEDREQKLQQYRHQAISNLKRSVRHGFRDFEWMRNDPELESLRGLPEFKQIHSTAEHDKRTSVKTSEREPAPRSRVAIGAVAHAARDFPSRRLTPPAAISRRDRPWFI